MADYFVYVLANKPRGTLHALRGIMDGRVKPGHDHVVSPQTDHSLRLDAGFLDVRTLLAGFDLVNGCDRWFGPIVRQLTLERVADTQREARPDRGSEIQRHPDNLILPLGKVVRHDPARAR